LALYLLELPDRTLSKMRELKLLGKIKEPLEVFISRLIEEELKELERVG